MPAAVILVHGLRTSATMWRQQRDDLEARGLTVFAVDLPGHGSRMSERFTIDGARAVISDTVDAALSMTGQRPLLVGFSLGGYLSIEWAANHPDRVCGLVAAACGTDPGRLVLAVWRQLARLIHSFPDRGLALNNAAVRVLVRGPGADDVLVGGVALEVMNDALTALGQLRPSSSLPMITIPVTFVNGALDHVRLHERRMLAATRRGSLVTVPGATHLVSVIKPRQFTDILLVAYATATGTPVPTRLL